MEYNPTSFEVAQIYLQRMFRWRQNSSPYISGDAFADFCDFVYRPPKFRSFRAQRRSIDGAETIYVVGTDFPQFVKDFGTTLNPSAIIIGNSDFEYKNFDNSLFGSHTRIFSQNSFVSDNIKIFTIPIGIENLRLGQNGLHKYMQFQKWESRSKRVLIGPFGNTHKLRNVVTKDFSSTKGPWDVAQGYIKPQDYVKLSARYQYIAAVRGNGVDTHRFWESLYRGAIPIVLEDSWSKSLEGLGLPFLSTRDWRPATVIELIENHNAQKFDPLRVDALWMPYWQKMING